MNAGSLLFMTESTVSKDHHLRMDRKFTSLDGCHSLSLLELKELIESNPFSINSVEHVRRETSYRNVC